jgi:hypothetical protein
MRDDLFLIMILKTVIDMSILIGLIFLMILMKATLICGLNILKVNLK